MSDETDQIAKHYRAELERIRADSDLSEEGRRRKMARAKVDADDALRGIREQEASAAAQRRDQLVKRLFGPTGSYQTGSDTLATRDALARADAITRPSEAADLLRLAAVSGDASLARAIAAKAFDKARAERAMRGDRERASDTGWTAVLALWAEETGSTDELAELDQIDRVGGNRAARIRRRLMEQMDTTAPPELAGTRDVHQLAREADEGGSA